MKKLIFLLILTVIASSAFCKTITVTSSADSGVGTLRQAVLDASANDTIVFEDSIISITLIDQINIDKNITITGNALNTTVLKRNGNGTDKKRHFDIVNKESEVIFNYLTLRDNHVNCDGGAIASAGKLTLNNCVFSNNKANYTSGAILSYGTLFAYSCTFNNNSSSSVGGAIRCNTAKIEGCIFQSNSGSNGGAIFLVRGSDSLYTLNIKNCFFKENIAQSFGGAVTNYGNTIVESCLFNKNATSDAEAAIANTGNILIKNSLFDANESKEGGVFSNRYYSLMTQSPNATFVNCLFFNNTLNENKQNIGLLKNDSYSTLTVINSTFANNQAAVLSINNGNYGSINLYNNIFWNNVTTNGDEYDFYVGGTDTIITAFNNIVGKTNSSLLSSSNFIGLDPSFVGNGDYSLAGNSPAINAGVNSFLADTILTDLLGNPRIYGALIDLGAYEYQSTASNLHILKSDINIYSIGHTIYVDNTSSFLVSIYDMMGELVAQDNKSVFQVSHAGVYLVCINNTVQKVIVK